MGGVISGPRVSVEELSTSRILDVRVIRKWITLRRPDLFLDKDEDDGLTHYTSPFNENY